jgi:cellulose biosynthesis protein BcsQ
LVANDENDPGKLLAAVEKARDAGVEWLFIDTAAGIHPLHSVAASVADVVLIPTTPSIRDQQVTADTVRLVLDEKKPGFLFISKGSQSKSKNDRVALGLSTAFKIPSLSTHIVLRTPTQDADLRGETLFDLDSKESSVVAGKEEFRALWQWLREHFGEQVGEQVETAHAEE